MASLQSTFSLELLDWFRTHQRPLPWRKNYRPYEVWISEIMLQQTQMDRVVEYFLRWMAIFPDVKDLAEAQLETVYKLWEGLGYYSRAANLHKAAAIIVKQYNGKLPDSYDRLLALPGIGPYTAGAIMSIAFEKNYPVVDGNVKRLLARFFDYAKPIANVEAHQFFHKKSAALMPDGKARAFNQAMMELGALICKPGRPQCHDCPVKNGCLSLQRGTVDVRPVKKEKQKLIPIDVVAAVICHQGKIYIQKRLPDMRWGNLWEFPGGHVEPQETPIQALHREVLEETEFLLAETEALGRVTSHFTKYKITLHAYRCTLKNDKTSPVLTAASEYKWLPLEALDAYAFSSGHRKLLNKILSRKIAFSC